MTIPTIGRARGVFGIFVPGLFLLANLVVFICLFPWTEDPVLSLVLGLGFGYLAGVVLRLFSAEPADKWSAAWLRKFGAGCRRSDGTFEWWATERFPYIRWIGEMSRLYLPPAARRFYKDVWEKTLEERFDDRLAFKFVNFCKVIVEASNESSGDECYAAEALVRYMSGILYALIASFFLVLGTFVLRWLCCGDVMPSLLIVLIAYSVAICAILSKFRFVRTKESETVFAACFANRKRFEALLGRGGTDETISDEQ